MSDTIPYRPAQRVVTRIVADFMIQVLSCPEISSMGDIKKSLVFLTVAQATDRPKQLRAMASDAHKLISIRGAARSLDLPYETVRRYAEVLVEGGLCGRVGREGVALSGNAATKATLSRARRAIGKRFLGMLRDLSAIAFDFDALDAKTVSGEKSGVQVRRSARARFGGQALPFQYIACNFFLRMMEVGMKPHNRNIERAAIFIAIMVANTQHYTYDAQVAWQYATAQTAPPDEMRRPVSVTSLAAMLNMPFETVRRHVKALIRAGRCVRVAGEGIVAPAHVMQRPEILDSGTLLTLRFAQAIADLKRHGFDPTALQKIPRR